MDHSEGRSSRPHANGDPALRRNYVRLFVSGIIVTDEQITASGTRAALEAAVAHGSRNGVPAVPSFDRKWCRLQDSNLRPPHYECDALPAELKRRPSGLGRSVGGA